MKFFNHLPIGFVALSLVLGAVSVPCQANIPKRHPSLSNLVDLRWIDESANEHALVMALNGSHEQLHLETESIITIRDIERAETLPSTPGKASVSVNLSPAGSAKLALATAENTGRRLGVVIDGKLLTAPKILDPITGGQAVLLSDIKEEEARRLVRVINEGLWH